MFLIIYVIFTFFMNIHRADIRYPRVLPEPVLAIAKQSRPLKAWGQAEAQIGVGVSYPTSLIVF